MTRFTRPRATRVGARSGNTLRPVEWIRDCEPFTGIAPLGAGTIGFVIVTAPEFDDFTRPTVVRIRGELTLAIGDIALGNGVTAVYGITIVNPGEPSPDPFAERRGNRWLWWGCTSLSNSGGTVEYDSDSNFVRVPFDVKSMRKRMVDGSNLQLCVVVSDGTAGLSAAVSASTLIKE